MKVQLCEGCCTEIPTGEAVRRASGDFATVKSWHRDCYDAAHPVVIPEQRSADTSMSIESQTY
ncbi:MAG TPA: hypothetical protein VJL80_09845 [Aeromicrobium sp.]|nr:hypothetical protein [Aeromicrobium sp.]HKY58328.1 hypothetical protein [Aeromicrobium sp.]